jgi:hypothetical protein
MGYHPDGTPDCSGFGFIEKKLPTEQKRFHQEQGMHILRGFSME